jgi:hypothetical protein
MRDANREREKAIQAFVQLDDEIKQAIADCNFDLYYGPSCGTSEAYTGFVSSCKTISEALSDVGDLWLDEQSGEVCDTEPSFCEGCDDETCTGSFPGDWYHYDRSEVARILVGRELAPYVR